MKVDQTKLKKRYSEVPPDCKALIDKLKSCTNEELLEELSKMKAWNYGECELYHWIDVLDTFDHILEISCEKSKENQWCLPCDGPHGHKKLLLSVLQFTALLIEHSLSWHLYNSMEHLTTLMSSSDMNVVLAVVNLLYVFSKKSNFMTRLNAENKQTLKLCLLCLAKSWGGARNGFGLAECCQNLPIIAYPSIATTLRFQYYVENVHSKDREKTSNKAILIRIDNIDKISHKSPSEIMEELLEKYAVPKDKQMQLFTNVRLAHSFSDYPKRKLCIEARLQALSVLMYCSAAVKYVNSLLYRGLIEELLDVLELQDSSLIAKCALQELKANAMRTLTSIILVDRSPKLSTKAASYRDSLPDHIRSSIEALIELHHQNTPENSNIDFDKSKSINMICSTSTDFENSSLEQSLCLKIENNKSRESDFLVTNRNGCKLLVDHFECENINKTFIHIKDHKQCEACIKKYLEKRLVTKNVSDRMKHLVAFPVPKLL